MGFGFEEIHDLISGPTERERTSFTALLELHPPEAVELLVKEDYPAKPMPPPIFPSDISLIDRASKFSVFASADNPPESSNIFPANVDLVKQEPLEADSHVNPSSPALSNQSLKSSKRKEREKKVKESNKKSKKVVAKEASEESCEKLPYVHVRARRGQATDSQSKKVVAKEASEESCEKLPYVHVRARRGQATDSHSLAERTRREKINARMKLLQELVPGCNKISGTAMVLDEIINHVQALQCQVEFLSMRIAAVNPRINFNLDALLAAESGSSTDNNYLGMVAPSIWPEGQINGSRQHEYQQPWLFDAGLHHSTWAREEDTSNLIAPESSLLSYDSPANSGKPQIYQESTKSKTMEGIPRDSMMQKDPYRDRSIGYD